MIWWLVTAAVVVAAYAGGMAGAILVGANQPVPPPRTVTVEVLRTDLWYPLVPAEAGGGRPTEQR